MQGPSTALPVDSATGVALWGVSGGDVLALPLGVLPPAKTDSFFVAHLRLRPKGFDALPAGCTVVLQATPAGTWKPATFAQYAASQFVAQSAAGQAVPKAAQRIAPPKGLEALPPWENPAVAPEDQQASLEALGLSANGPAGMATAAAPLRVGAEAGPQAAGCAATGSGGPSGLVWLVLLAGGIAWVWRRRRIPSALVLAGGALATTLAPAPAHAGSCTIYGYIEYWDTRPVRQPSWTAPQPRTGVRYEACDVTGASVPDNCLPGDPNCCFTPLRFATVKLYRFGSSTPVDTYAMGRTGYYTVTDPNCAYGTEYNLEVEFVQTQPLASMELHMLDGSNDDLALVHFDALTPVSGQTYYYRGHHHLNQKGDTTAIAGDWAAMWESLNDVFYALRYDESETRFQHHPGNTGYDLIVARYYLSGLSYSSAKCDSLIKLLAAEARTRTVTHMAGHIEHMRVLGCSRWLNPDVNPTVGPMAADGQSYEGSLQESIADLIGMLGWWDADTASHASVFAWLTNTFGTPCVDTSTLNNVNDAGRARNNWLALWEWLDRDTSGADQYSDIIDVSVKQLFDTVEAWMNGSCTSANHSRCEFDNTNTPGYCSPTYTTEACCSSQTSCSGGAGSVCTPQGDCAGPDAHGGNIADWARWMTSQLGGNYSDYLHSLTASPCMGSADNTWPFLGGYHTD